MFKVFFIRIYGRGIRCKYDLSNMLAITIDVLDIDRIIKNITAAGGVMITFKTVLLGIGWMVVFRDLEWNILGIIESDESAK